MGFPHSSSLHGHGAAPPVPQRVALVTLGTWGDVNPLMALGRALGARGHHVTLMTNPVYADAAQAQGLGFAPIGTAQQQADTLAHPKLWHTVDGLGVMWRYMLRPALRPTVQALHHWQRTGPAHTPTLVVANPLAMGARLVQEQTGQRLVSTYTAATPLRTVQAPMTLAQWRVPRWVPKPLLHAAWWALDRAKLHPLVMPELQALRAELGLPALPPAESVFGRWMHAPHAGLTLFPSWFAPMAADWPPQVRCGHFALHDDATALDASLTTFLQQGPAPVVVMPGSGQQHAAGLYRAAFRGLLSLGRRGVLLGAVPPDVVRAAQQQPTQWWVGGHQPFNHLLPQAAALLHHGGVGSAAQALRAGVPQVVWPQAYDQFDNAMRLEQLGVAVSLGAGLPTSEAVAQAVHHACTQLGATATQVAQRMPSTQAALTGLCLQLEALP